MEYIVQIPSDEPSKRNFSTLLDTTTLKKLDVLKKHLNKNNCKTTKGEIVDTALNEYFEKFKIKECEIKKIVSLTIKQRGYEVKK